MITWTKRPNSNCLILKYQFGSMELFSFVSVIDIVDLKMVACCQNDFAIGRKIGHRDVAAALLGASNRASISRRRR